ncbi:MAG TPA: hypothetical protein VIZ68_07035 [Thermoplasmata archaeon]
MALFSDIDWAILAAVAGFFILGKDGGTIVRQAGRMYGRLTRLKTELLSEFTKAADLPDPRSGAPMTIRRSLLDWTSEPGRLNGVPIAVTTPPAALARVDPPPSGYAGGFGPSTWSVSHPMSSGRRGGEP